MAHEQFGLNAPSFSTGVVTFTKDAGEVAAGAEWKLTDARVRRTFEIEEKLIDPGTGEALGRVMGRECIIATITVMGISSATTPTVAEAASALLTNLHDSVIAISGGHPPDLAGSYFVDGDPEVSIAGGQFASLTIPLKRYISGPTATQMTTDIS